MRFRVQERSKLEVIPPKFKCDAPIHKQIEPPLPNTPFFMAIIGSAGSGKTSLMINLMTSRQAYKKAFHAVHVVMPEHSVASLKNNVFKKHKRMHDELTLPVLQGVLDQVKEDAKEEYSSLLILDDVTATLKNKELQMLLKKAAYNRRHLRLSIMMLVQTYNAVPLAVRKTFSHFAAFKPRNKKEFSNIWEELLFIPRDVADALLRWLYDEPHTFMFADVGTGDIFRNFDLISYEEKDGAEEDDDDDQEEGNC